MAVLEDLFEGNLGTGLAVGIGVAIVGPLVAPFIAGVLRPAAKMAVKGGIYAYDRAHEAVAQLKDTAGDMVAEVRTEVEQKPATTRQKTAAG